MLTTNLKKPFYHSIISDNKKKEENNNDSKISDDNELMSFVGKNMRAIRKSQMKTISEIAELAELSPKYLQSVEVGKRNISITNLNKIAKSLDVPIAVLFSYDHIEKTKKLINISNKLRNYSELQLTNIDAIIKELKKILD